MKPIIKVEGLSKQYRIGVRPPEATLRDALVEAVRNPFKRMRARANAPTVWALKGVSFDVQPGEVVGLVGSNGAGKSTLLKILSRIVEPTSGRAELYGRVGSLLEVGTGFHPELTGRENVFLNGAMLGMRRAEIARKFDEIVAFSEIEKFIDTPVKHYSSGMYTRLAFAVAAHLEPEILIVDEVLAVGDMAFQKKCLGKIGEVSRAGRTVLFVSHNMIAVQNLCERVVWLNKGVVVEDGRTGEVLRGYFSSSNSNATERVWEDMADAPGDDKVRLRRVCIRPEAGEVTDAVTVETPFVIECEYWNLAPGAYKNISLHLYNDKDVLVFATAPTSDPLRQQSPFPSGLFRSTCRVPGNLMNDGTCRVQLLVIENGTVAILNQEDALVFDILEHPGARSGAWYGKWAGVVRPQLEWHTEMVAPAPSISMAGANS